MRRGDLITVASQGDYGKPRPALIVQADVFLDYASITVLPLSSDLQEADLFRIDVLPSPSTGLKQAFADHGRQDCNVPDRKGGQDHRPA